MSGTSNPTHFPIAPIHSIRYSSADTCLPPAMASITSAVLQGWMKKTGRL